MTCIRKSGSSFARGPMVKSSAAAPASTWRLASAWIPAMSPDSSSAFVLLNPGLILSPMTVNSGAAPVSFKADSPHENALEAGQRSQFQIAGAQRECPGAIAKRCGGERHARPDAGCIADLLDSGKRQGREQTDSHRAFQSDVGAKGTCDHHALDGAFLEPRFLKQAIDARADGRLGELDRAHVVLREGPPGGERDLAMVAVRANRGMTGADPAATVDKSGFDHRSQGVQHTGAAQADRLRVAADDLDLEAAIDDAPPL